MPFAESPLRGLGRALSATVGITPAARPDPARILLGMTMPIGDTLFAQPAVAAVRRRFPLARLTAVAWPTNAPVVAGNPDIDDLLIYHNDPADRTFIDRFDDLLRQVQARRFDMLIGFAPSSNCIGILSGIPRQVWIRLPFAFWLWGTTFDHAYRERHAVDHYWRVVGDLGLMPRSPADRIPRWQVADDEREEARALLAEAGIATDGTRPIVLIHPGAAGFGGRKRWPIESFGELACQILTHHTAQIVVLGGPAEAPLAAQIVRATNGRAVSVAGQVTLRQSIALISQAALYIGNDSGLTHFAVALDCPTVALYGVSHLAQFAPRAADPCRVRVLLPHPTPPPAGFFIGTQSGLFPPPFAADDRMQSISVASVYAAVASLGLPANLLVTE